MKLHNYQKYMVDFILKNPIAAVFLDMGLGKTVIALTAIKELIYERFEVSKVLVVAPLRVAKNTWGAEIEKWEHLKGLRYSVVVGTAKERMQALGKEADVYIINRENLSWLIKHSKLEFDFICIDELSSFKNRATERHKAMMYLRRTAKRIVGLTGTPSSNGLMDLWAEFKVLDCGQRLGRYITQYRNRYFVPDKRNGMVVYSYKPIAGAEQMIYKAIGDITVSMRAKDYLEMPDLINVVQKVSMADRTKYDELKKEMVMELDGETITAANAASLSNKLVQMANGAVYTGDGYSEVHSAKLDALIDIVEAAAGKPVLVAYWYKHDLERIKQRLEGYKLATIDTEASIKAWNAGKLEVGLIHPASAGHGLNLQQGGSVLVWFGLTWSLELYQQCIGRLYRQGQTDKAVVVQHIVCEGTIDEQIVKALQSKEDTQDALINAVKAELEVK